MAPVGSVTSEGSGPLWRPSPERVGNACITAFRRKVEKDHGVELASYRHLHDWSVKNPERFWAQVWSFAGVVGDRNGDTVLANADRMPGARWFPEARLNFAENLLKWSDGNDAGGDALVFWGEDRARRRFSHGELRQAVFRLARALRAAGVRPGDRVAGYLPNTPEAVIAALGALSIGATWSSCSPDFGTGSVLDRLRQIEPKVLFATDGYIHKGAWCSVQARAARIAAGLPSLELVVRVPYGGECLKAVGSSGEKVAWSRNTGNRADPGGGSEASDGVVGVPYGQLVEGFPSEPIEFERFPFDHPLYILFSSGTTGTPKCIVHGAGGTLLQHLKEHVLHGDVKPGDRVFYYTTCGWMMWNWLVSALAAGATLLLYDGSPLAGDRTILFDLADEERMTHFGTSARFIDQLRSRGISPAETHSLSSVRTMFSTGSPLLPESFDFVYENIKKDLCLSSISGGTDIVSCFVLGNPTLPVWRGEIQCRGLGMSVEIFDEDGRSVVDAKGELVCTAPFPSMPLGFRNDPAGEEFRAAYFEKYPGVWCHGDYARITPRGGVVIYGRSDTVLNPGGVRMGTAEIYRPLEEMEEILESVVIGQEWAGDVRVVLFVRLRPSLVLDEDLTGRIKEQIRRRTSPWHVPSVVLAVSDIPRTRNGKVAELAVRAVVHGQPVKNYHALANPESLAHFTARPELAS